MTTVPQSPRALSASPRAPTVPTSPRAMPNSPQAWNGTKLPGANPRLVPAPLIAMFASTSTGSITDTPAAAAGRPQPAPQPSPKMVHRVVGVNMVPPQKPPGSLAGSAVAPPSPAQVLPATIPWAFLHNDKASVPQTPVQTHRMTFPAVQHLHTPLQTPVQSFRNSMVSGTPVMARSESCVSGSAQGAGSAVLEAVGKEASRTSSPSTSMRSPRPSIARLEGHEASSPSAKMRKVGNEVSSSSAELCEGRTDSDPNSCPPDGSAETDADGKPMDGETIKKLHQEIGSLRSELEALRGFLDDGDGRGVGQALRSIWGSTSIDVRINEEEEEVTSPRSPHDGARLGASHRSRSSVDQLPSSPITLSMSTPPRPSVVRRPTKQATSPHRMSTPQLDGSQKAQRSSSASRLSRDRSCSGSLEQTDCIDDMWCTALRCFPNHPHWTMLKVSSGVYRLGSRTGKKILCQISHGGLQVRVGGGWMSANSFLQKYGSQYMGSGMGAENTLDSSTDTPVNMERLLVPTKSWANKIGINTSPDLREMRRPGDNPKECQAAPASPR